MSTSSRIRRSDSWGEAETIIRMKLRDSICIYMLFLVLNERAVLKLVDCGLATRHDKHILRVNQIQTL